MKRVLSDYLEIYNKFRTDGLSKLERKQRYTLLSEWEQTAYDDESVNIIDIQDFWNSHNRIYWNKTTITLTRSNTSIIRSNIFLSSLYMRYLPVC